MPEAWEKYWPVKPLNVLGHLAPPIEGRYYYALFPRNDPKQICPLCGGNWQECSIVFDWADSGHNRIVKVHSRCTKMKGVLFRWTGVDVVGDAAYLSEAYATSKKKEVKPTKKVRGPHLCTCSKAQLWKDGCICGGK